MATGAKNWQHRTERMPVTNAQTAIWLVPGFADSGVMGTTGVRDGGNVLGRNPANSGTSAIIFHSAKRPAALWFGR